MPRKYVSPKKIEKVEKWTNDFVKKLTKSKRWSRGEEATLSHAKHLANEKWKRKQRRRNIETYIPLPNKLVNKLDDKRRKKGLI